MARLKVVHLQALVGLLFVGVFILQTTRSMYLDAYSIEGSRLDLIGYLASVAVGAVLALHALKRRYLFVGPIAVLAGFMLILAINVELNSDESFKSVLFSRHGIFTWLYIGICSALSVRAIRYALEKADAKWLRNMGLLVVAATSVPIGLLVNNYLDVRTHTLSYQAVANNAIIVICTTILVLNALNRAGGQPGRLRNLPTYVQLILASFLVYAVALMQSTGIIAFWAVGLPIILFGVASESNVSRHLVTATLFAIGLFWMFSSFFLADLLSNTRFAAFDDGIFALSSVQTRLGLFNEFFPQFGIAPVFGHFHAEVRAGYSLGEYVHSLPLSLLTHTGVFGFLIFATAWMMISYRKSREVRKNGHSARLAYHLFLAVSALAALYTFFTWSPLWFFLGFMCVKGFSPAGAEGTSR